MSISSLIGTIVLTPVALIVAAICVAAIMRSMEAQKAVNILKEIIEEEDDSKSPVSLLNELFAGYWKFLFINEEDFDSLRKALTFNGDLSPGEYPDLSEPLEVTEVFDFEKLRVWAKEKQADIVRYHWPNESPEYDLY